MSATVAKGPFKDDTDQCIMCNFMTPYWWGDGCAPLCQACAAETTDKDVYKLCARLGYGPLPKDKP